MCLGKNFFFFLLHRMDRLYWVDAQLDRIEHVSIDGLDRQAFSSIGQITHPFSLTIHTGCHFCVSSLISQPHYDVDIEMILNYKACYTATEYIYFRFVPLVTDCSVSTIFRSFVCVRLEDEFCFSNEEEGWWGKYNPAKGHLGHNECQGLFS